MSIGWGVCGEGYRHFVCDCCGARLGYSKTIQPFMIKHECGDGVCKTGPVEEAEVEKGQEGPQEQNAERRKEYR